MLLSLSLFFNLFFKLFFCTKFIPVCKPIGIQLLYLGKEVLAYIFLYCNSINTSRLIFAGTQHFNFFLKKNKNLDTFYLFF
jgi:hypothetical protein